MVKFDPRVSCHDNEGLVIDIRPDDEVFGSLEDGDIEHKLSFTKDDVERGLVEYANSKDIDLGHDIGDNLFGGTKQPKIISPTEGEVINMYSETEVVLEPYTGSLEVVKTEVIVSNHLNFTVKATGTKTNPPFENLSVNLDILDPGDLYFKARYHLNGNVIITTPIVKCLGKKVVRVNTVDELVDKLNNGVTADSIDTSLLTSLEYFWCRLKRKDNLQGMGKWKLSAVKSAKCAFGYPDPGYRGENQLEDLGYSDFGEYCSGLGIENWDMPLLEDASFLFRYCPKGYNVADTWKFDKVKTIRGCFEAPMPNSHVYNLFKTPPGPSGKCTWKLTSLEDASRLYYGGYNRPLKQNIDLSHATNLSELYACADINISGPGKYELNTGSCVNGSRMFYSITISGASRLELSLDLTNATNLDYMFCRSSNEYENTNNLFTLDVSNLRYGRNFTGVSMFALREKSIYAERNYNPDEKYYASYSVIGFSNIAPYIRNAEGIFAGIRNDDTLLFNSFRQSTYPNLTNIKYAFACCHVDGNDLTYLDDEIIPMVTDLTGVFKGARIDEFLRNYTIIYHKHVTCDDYMFGDFHVDYEDEFKRGISAGVSDITFKVNEYGYNIDLSYRSSNWTFFGCKFNVLTGGHISVTGNGEEVTGVLASIKASSNGVYDHIPFDSCVVAADVVDYMFANSDVSFKDSTSSLNIKLSTSVKWMFTGCKQLNANKVDFDRALSNVFGSDVVTVRGCFMGSALDTIFYLGSYNYPNLVDFSYLFADTNASKGFQYVDGYFRIAKFKECNYDGFLRGTKFNSDISSIVFYSSCNELLMNCKEYTYPAPDISNCKTHRNVFYGCSKLTDASMGGKEFTSEDATGLFAHCENLVKIPPKFNLKSDGKYAHMFESCFALFKELAYRKKSLNVHFDEGSILRDPMYMFGGLNAWTTEGEVKLLSDDSAIPTIVGSCEGMFKCKYKKYDIYSSSSFGGAAIPKGYFNFKILSKSGEQVTSTAYMFYGASVYEEGPIQYVPDFLSKLTSNKTAAYMFSGVWYDPYPIDDINPNKNTRSVGEYNINLYSSNPARLPDLSKMRMPECEDFSYMFAFCGDIETDVGLNGALVTRKAKTTEGMFYCSIPKKSLANFDMSNVVNASKMFLSDRYGWAVITPSIPYYDPHLRTSYADINGIENWDVGNCKHFDYMFASIDVNRKFTWYNGSTNVMVNVNIKGYSKLDVDISNWNIVSVETWDNIFYECDMKEEYKPPMFRDY